MTMSQTFPVVYANKTECKQQRHFSRSTTKQPFLFLEKNQQTNMDFIYLCTLPCVKEMLPLEVLANLTCCSRELADLDEMQDCIDRRKRYLFTTDETFSSQCVGVSRHKRMRISLRSLSFMQNRNCQVCGQRYLCFLKRYLWKRFEMRKPSLDASTLMYGHRLCLKPKIVQHYFDREHEQKIVRENATIESLRPMRMLHLQERFRKISAWLDESRNKIVRSRFMTNILERACNSTMCNEKSMKVWLVQKMTGQKPTLSASRCGLDRQRCMKDTVRYIDEINEQNVGMHFTNVEIIHTRATKRRLNYVGAAYTRKKRRVSSYASIN